MLKKGKSDTIFFNVLKQTQLYMNRLSLRIVQNKKVRIMLFILGIMYLVSERYMLSNQGKCHISTLILSPQKNMIY